MSSLPSPDFLVTATGSTTPRRIADRFALENNILDFGGSGNGVIDNLAPLNALLAALPAAGGTVRFPAGRFRVSALVSYTFPNGPCRIVFLGEGQGVTELVWPNAAGGLSFTWSNQENAIAFCGLSFTTQQASGGTAVKIINTGIYGGFQEATQNLFDRCTFQGDGGTNAGYYWTVCVSIQAVSYFAFTDCLLYGGVVAGTRVGTGVALSDYSGVITANFNFTDCSLIDLNIAIAPYNNPQGISSSQSSFVDCNYGIWATGTVPQVGMQIEACNMACFSSAIYTQNEVDDLQVIGNTFYVFDTTGTYPGINLALTSRFTINDNDFLAPAATTSPAIRIGNNFGWSATIASNAIAGPFTTGISLQAASSRIVVSGNSFGSTVGTNVVNAGSYNSIDEAMPWTPVLAFGGASVGITYAVQAGSFVKTAQMCVATFRITLTNKGSSTGIATVTGVLFGTPTTASGDIGYYTGMISATGLTGYLGGGTWNFTIPGATGIVAATDANFTNSSDIIVTLTYPATP